MERGPVPISKSRATKKPLPARKPGVETSQVGNTPASTAFRFEPILCIAGVVVALAAIAVNLFAPILSFPFPQPDGSSVATWTDLRNPNASGYEQGLLIIPIVAYAVAAAIGAAVVARDRLPEKTALRLLPLETPTVWLLGLMGFLLALTGTRWLGFYFSQLAPDGPALSHLHVVPYLNLGLGLLLLTAAAWTLTRDKGRYVLPFNASRWVVLSVLVAAGGLLLMPLLPFAQAIYDGTTVPLEEFILAVMASQQSFWSSDAPRSLLWVRASIWAVLATSLFGLLMEHLHAFSLLPRRLQWTRHAPRIHILFVAVGILTTVNLYIRTPDIRPNVRFYFNPFPLLTLLLLGILWWLHGRQAGRRMPRL